MISIIIPTLADKNRIQSLRRLLFSLVKQTYQKFEIYIILDIKLDEDKFNDIKKEIIYGFDIFLTKRISFFNNVNSEFQA
jgi:glycosyltransferase involved in cell wall biosynthesis